MSKPSIRSAPGLLYLTAFIEGFTILSIEIVGGKIVNSYFGSSYIVWAFILGITLLGLAAGYYSGGVLSAGKNNENVVFGRLALGAVLVALMPFIATPVFSIFSESSIYVGLGVSVCLILGPSLFCVGSLTSLLINLASRSLNLPTGRNAGMVYGISTLGGVLSTFIMGFYLIPQWGLSYPLLAVALMLLGCAYKFKAGEKKLGLKFLAAGLIVGLLFLSKMSGGSKRSGLFSIPYESEGILGQLKVLDYKPPGQGFSVRRLLINGIPQTFIINDPRAYSYWRYPHFISGFATIKDTGSSVLLVGFGGGSVARELKNQHFKFDVVELDERIMDLAKKFFYFNTDDHNFVIDDIRHFIRVSPKKYDLVVFDILSGEVQPNYAFTIEALKDFKRMLKPNGMAIINYQGIRDDKRDKAFASLYLTFKTAGFYTYYWATDPSVFEDIVFVISTTPLQPAMINPDRLNECCKALPQIKDFLKAPFADEKRTFPEINVLTDDKPELDQLNRNAILYWRKVMLKDITNPQLKEGINLYK